jgi:1-deoxy-D-xylulose-5-phosphate synthase
MGTAVMEFMQENGYKPTIIRIGIPDKFIEHGTIPQLHCLCGMDVASITKAIVNKK